MLARGPALLLVVFGTGAPLRISKTDRRLQQLPH